MIEWWSVGEGGGLEGCEKLTCEVTAQNTSSAAQPVRCICLLVVWLKRSAFFTTPVFLDSCPIGTMRSQIVRSQAVL